MTRSLFIDNLRLAGEEVAILLAQACGVSNVVIKLWIMTADA